MESVVPHGDADLEAQLGDVLGDIEMVLSTPPPPMTGWSSIPSAPGREDDLAAIAAQLEAEREASSPDLLEAFASSYDEPIRADDTPDISVCMEELSVDDEPTQDWSPAPVPPDSFFEAPIPPPVRSAPFLSEPDFGGRDSMPSLVDTMEDAQPTLRPSAVSLPPYRPAKRPRLPVGLAIAAAASVAAAIVAYRLGPHSQPPARHVAVATQHAPAQLTAAEPQLAPRAPAAAPAVVEKQPLMVRVSPSNAYLSIRTLEEREGKRTTGPWPKTFDLTPGEYELVAFRAGHQPIVRRVTIEPGVRPSAIELKLRVEDIYE